MVDPAFANTCELPHALERKTPSVSAMASNEETTPDGITLNQVTKAALEECNILQAPTPYDSRAALWKAQDWGEPQSFQVVAHKSWPYHNGCPTLAPLMFTEIGIGAKEANIQLFSDRRNLVSPLDEMVFYWTKLATRDLIHHTNKKSSNAAYYLLKHIAQHWVNQLELINTTVARGEWFSDDYQAQIDDNLSQARWKADLIKINEIGKDINYMRRHLNHFWRAMILNLERLGVQLGSETVDENASLALKGAQKDFLTLHTRMQPLRDRAEALSSVANDLANLRAAFRGVHDGEFSLRLSLFASIVFPLTLVAGIFSMGDDFRPGKPQFWKLWAIGPPFCLSLALGLIYGKRPWKVVSDLRNSMKEFLRGLGHVGINETDISRQTERNKSAGAHVVKSTSTVQRMIKRRKGSQQCDEEQGSRD